MSENRELSVDFVCASLQYCESVPEKEAFFKAFLKKYHQAPHLLDEKLARQVAREMIRTADDKYQDLLSNIARVFLTRTIPTYEETAPALLEEAHLAIKDKGCQFFSDRLASYRLLDMGRKLCHECLPAEYPMVLLTDRVLEKGEYEIIQGKIRDYIQTVPKLPELLMEKLVSETLECQKNGGRDEAIQTLCLGMNKYPKETKEVFKIYEESLRGSAPDMERSLTALKAIAQSTQDNGKEVIRILHRIADRQLPYLHIQAYEIASIVVEKTPDLADEALTFFARLPQKDLDKDVNTARTDALTRINVANPLAMTRIAPDTSMKICTSMLMRLSS